MGRLDEAYREWTGKLPPFALLLLAAVVLGAAAPQVEAATRAEFDTAYEAMLDNPEDLEGILKFARIAIELGEYETAVGALERLMLSVGNVGTIRADLGFLYFRLGSPQIARYHLSAALDSGQLPPDLEARTRELIERATNATKRSTLQAALGFGMRYQSNPAAAGSDDDILVSGSPQRFASREDDDLDGFFSVRATHRYDLLTQNKAAIETKGTVFVDRFLDQSNLNTLFAELTPGIRFEPDPVDNKGITLRPHLIADMTMIDDELHRHAFGAGIEVRYAASDKLYAEAAFQHRQRRFNNRSGFTNVSRRDGYENRLGGALRYQLKDNVFLGLGGRLVDRDAEANFFSNVEMAATADVTFNYRMPLFGAPRAVSSFATVGWRETRFADPDPLVDPRNKRNDHEINFGVGTTVNLSRAWSVSLDGSYTTVDSNIRNFDRDNFEVGLSAVRRF